MSIRNYLFDLGKIIEGASNSDVEKVIAYADQLAKRLKDDGEVEGAKRLKEILGRSKAKKMSLARGQGLSASPALPVDTESRLPVADEGHWQPGEVPLFLPGHQKEAVARFLKYIRAADRLVASGVGVSPSLLVYGPPGCGKTQLARYIASELSLPLLTARADALISSYLGSTAKNVRALFEHAASRRCVLFLDEFDAIGKMRDDTRELGELKRVVISLLQNIDALGPDHLLIAATNHDHLLDPAIWRRFAYRMQLGTPDESARKAMLTAFLGKFADPDQVELFAAVSEDLTGAALRQIAEDAIREAVLNGESQKVETLSTLDHILGQRNNYNVSQSHEGMIAFLRELDPKRFTQPRLAKLFGVSQSHVSKILSANGSRDGRRDIPSN